MLGLFVLVGCLLSICFNVLYNIGELRKVKKGIVFEFDGVVFFFVFNWSLKV